MFKRTKTINRQTKNIKVMHKVDIRKVLGLLVATILLTSLVCYVAFSPTISFTTIIQEGSMRLEADYVFFIDDSTYYCRNGETGAVTSDSNVSALWDSVKANDTHIHFATGTYTVTHSLYAYNLYNLTISGSGYGSILKADVSLDTPIIEVNGTGTTNLLRGLTVFNLKLLGAPSGTQSRQHAIQLNYMRYSTISHVTIHRARGHGIYVNNCTGTSPGGIKIFNVEIWENIGGHAVFFALTADAQFTNSKIVGSGTVATPTNGILLSSASRILISGNEIDTNLKHGIEIYASHNNLVSSNSIYDNDFNDVGSYDGIFLYQSDNNTVTGNIVQSNARYDIHVSDAASDYNMIVGNGCVRNDHVAGIIDLGTNTEIHSCYNETTWIT